MKRFIIFAAIWLSAFSYSAHLWAFGEKPTFDDMGQAGTLSQPAPLGGPIPALSPVTQSQEKAASANTLTEDELAALKKKLQDSMKQNQFADALSAYQKIPTIYLSKKEKEYSGALLLFSKIDSEIASANPLLQKDTEVDEETKKNGLRLYREAQNAVIQGNTTLAKDLLIQVLYSQRWNFKAKKLLEYGLDMPPGSYRIEDMVTKYEEKSKISFYGGNYAAAVDSLNTLLMFKQEDPTLYERLGSCYYMMGEAKKAIESWNTALFFNPNNKELEKIVANAKTALAEETKEAKEREKNRKTTTETKAASVETQVFGVYRTKNEAYNFAGELKKKGMTPVVEETDNGKWAVKVPVSQLQKKN